MRVCFFSHSADLHGAERSLLDLLDYMHNKAIFTLVIVPRQGPMTLRLKKIGVQYIIFNHEQWVSENHPWITKKLRGLRNKCRSWVLSKRLKKYHLTHIYTNTMTIPVGSMVAQHLGLPHIWHIREMGLKHFSFKFDFPDSIVYDYILEKSHHVICVSKAVSEIFNLTQKNKVSVVYNNVSLPKDMRIRKAEPPDFPLFRCLVIGELNPSKKAMDAVKAIAQLNKEGLPVLLEIYGGGNKELKEEIEKYAKTQSLSNRIKCKGRVDEAVRFIPDAHLLLVPSPFEALPRVIMEAMRCKRAVITTDTGGAKELIDLSQAGLTFQYGNIENFSKTIRDLLINEEKRHKHAENGYKWISQNISDDQCFKKITDILQL